MIRWVTALARIGLVVAAIATTLPMIAFAQTSEPTIESVPTEAEEANASPTDDQDGTGDDTSTQAGPSSRSAIPVEVEAEFQRLLTQHRSELLDDRAAYIDRWLAVIAIVLTFFGIVVAVASFLGFRRFREIEIAANSSVATVTEIAETSKRHLKEIESNREKSDEILRSMNAERAADNPQAATQVVAKVSENPRASLIDQAIASAVSLQQQGKTDEAIEKWRALAHITEGSDNNFASSAWVSVGYLLKNKDYKSCMSAYEKAICLNPVSAEAYNSRGVAKGELKQQYKEAISDLDEAIRLDPDYAKAYSNRGLAKSGLKQYKEAISDLDEAIRLDPDYAKAYGNRGLAKAELKQYKEALSDFEEATRLDPVSAEAYLNRGVAKAALERHDDAIADYNEALRLQPDSAEAYYNRGISEAASGLKAKALKDFTTALKLARHANNTALMAHVEQLIHDRNDAEGS